MTALSTPSHDGIDVRVIVTNDENELAAIAQADVQAVIYRPPPPAWLQEIAEAVEAGRFRIARNILPDVRRDEIARWLEGDLPTGVVSDQARADLKDDIVALTDRLHSLTGAVRFMLRIFTEAPSTECSFHVDTVPPGAPAVGLLRVYNGAGTDYVDPTNLTSFADFYRYLGRHERLRRDRRTARQDGDAAALLRLEREIAAHGAARPFLRRPDENAVAPAGSIVAFRHIDVRHHWSDHFKARAWIHSSPMTGTPRLVVNLTSPQRPPRRRPARGGDSD